MRGQFPLLLRFAAGKSQIEHKTSPSIRPSGDINCLEFTRPIDQIGSAVTREMVSTLTSRQKLSALRVRKPNGAFGGGGADIGSCQVGPSKISTRKIGVHKVSVFEIGALEIGL